MVDPEDGDIDEEVPDALEFPIDGTLDLHTFRPSEVRELVADYLEECRRRGILEVRIIHGKGTGRLRETVRRILSNHPGVRSFHTPSDSTGTIRSAPKIVNRKS